MKDYEKLQTRLDGWHQLEQDALSVLHDIASDAIVALEKETDRADQMTQSREAMTDKRDILSEENGTLRAKVFTLEEENKKITERLQFICTHTHGKTYIGGNSAGLCTCCGWDMGKCQHKESITKGYKFCIYCGELAK